MGQPISPEAGEMIATLMEASMASSQRTTNRLIDSLASERDLLQAEVLLIQRRVAELFEGPYMPTSYTMIRALHPSRAEIEYALTDFIETGEIRPLQRMQDEDSTNR